MALPSSGVMKASMIQAELGESGSWSINSQSSRTLAKVPSGTIKFTDFYGKSKEITEIIANFTIGRYYRGRGLKKRYRDGFNPPNYESVSTAGAITIIEPSNDEANVRYISTPAWTANSSSLNGSFMLGTTINMGNSIRVVIQDIGTYTLTLNGEGEAGYTYFYDLPANSAPLSSHVGQTKRLTITKLYYNLVQLLREVI